MSEHDEQLSAALRRMSAGAPQWAPPALGEKLKSEFRRHHIRRRRERNARILLIAACLAVSAFTVLELRPRGPKVTAIRSPAEAAAPQHEDVTSKIPELSAARPKSVRKRALIRGGKPPESAAERFVALPTFDSTIPIDQLEIVRVNLPGRDLRLVGFPVSEEIADRRVLADVLLAQDGRPFALRLVQNSATKEQ
jgi:hypothetical protein